MFDRESEQASEQELVEPVLRLLEAVAELVPVLDLVQLDLGLSEPGLKTLEAVEL